MLRSCKYCGRIHDSKYKCPARPQYKKNSNADKFRQSKEWRHKREDIKDRDKCFCQVCIRKLYDTINQYNYTDIQVHHAIPINEDYDRRLDDNNLITICSYHHELAEDGRIPRRIILDIIAEQEQGHPPGCKN